jgi:hypothetical protein
MQGMTMKKDETTRFVVGCNATATFSMLRYANTFTGDGFVGQTCATMMGSPGLRPLT